MSNFVLSFGHSIQSVMTDLLKSISICWILRFFLKRKNSLKLCQHSGNNQYPWRTTGGGGVVTFIRILQNVYFFIYPILYVPTSFQMLLIDKLLLNKYFGRNMHKNTLFSLKNCKKSPSAGVFTSRPPCLRRLGLRFQTPNDLKWLKDPLPYPRCNSSPLLSHYEFLAMSLLYIIIF